MSIFLHCVKMRHTSHGHLLIFSRDKRKYEMTRVLTLVCRYYPQIDVCQSEKDGDIAAKKKELELAAEEDFGNSRVHICVDLLISGLDSF